MHRIFFLGNVATATAQLTDQDVDHFAHLVKQFAVPHRAHDDFPKIHAEKDLKKMHGKRLREAHERKLSHIHEIEQEEKGPHHGEKVSNNRNGFTAEGNFSFDELMRGKTNVVKIPHHHCSDGSRYFTIVVPPKHGALGEKVALDFMGGGACFNDETCNALKFPNGKKFYTDEMLISGLRSVAHGRSMTDGTFATTIAPLFGFWPTTDDHPLADYTYIALVFCTADLFIGNQVNKYPNYWYDDTNFHHEGAANARAVIDLVKQQAPDVKKMFIIGGSAGGVGIHIWAPIITHEFPKVEVTAWSDSGLPWVPTDDAFTRAVNTQFKKKLQNKSSSIMIF